MAKIEIGMEALRPFCRQKDPCPNHKNLKSSEQNTYQIKIPIKYKKQHLLTPKHII